VKNCIYTCIFGVITCACVQAQPAAVLRGIVHDPQHRPVGGAIITLTPHNGNPVASLTSNREGEFEAQGLRPGDYRILISAPGFDRLEQRVRLHAGNNGVLHFQLVLAVVSASVQVSAPAGTIVTESSTVQNKVSRREIEETPGADQTNSLAMITDFTPGASMVHDMLHMRGGHQVTWFLDGVPLTNTSIANEVAPAINPKDVAELQVQRGGYSSEYGDRTYGLLNVVTPSGFDRDNEAELIATAGNFYSTDDQFDLGGHTDRFAYYASIDGTRSDLGLATPVPAVIHDGANGLGGFSSLLFNATPRDQLRLIASARSDDYQIPNSPEQQLSDIRDNELERDELVGFTWTHSFSPSLLFTLTPYAHWNRAEYISGPDDTPYILTDNNRSTYGGVRAVIQAQTARHSVSFGFESWAQHIDSFFGLHANPGESVLNQNLAQWADSETGFAEDQYKAASWLLLDLGLRVSRYAGLVDESAADPRLGAALRIPHLHWTLHGYYAYYYQPPPLDSLAGPSLAFAAEQGYGFVPLHGERDIQRDLGLTVPIRGWTLDADTFHTSAANFLDHDVIGNSGIFIPLTDLGAIIHGTEVTLTAPRLLRRYDLRIAYSNQTAQGVGPITGGLLESAPTGIFFLDHDQRNTLSTVLSARLPGHLWATPVYNFGSGFLNGDGPDHLPPRSTFDLAIGKDFGEHWALSINGTNLANTHYLLDNSNTFGGTHYVYPRQVYAQVRYRFHY
jgi:hypothetical protein